MVTLSDSLYSSGRYLTKKKYNVLHVHISVAAPMIGFAATRKYLKVYLAIDICLSASKTRII
jgi:hypothetical protein